ncbi:MAG: hypothetical protein QOG87_893 [Actinomycetota bacterium]
MSYRLGVDLGTTWTAAAVARGGRVEMAALGSRGAAVPSVIFVREDETILVGEPASRRGLTEPDRVVREFKRRFGDPTPILVGGTPYAADGLMAKMLRWVVDTVAAREGGPPDAVVVTHPANWGPYKLDLLAQAVRLADVGEAVVISEPEAAAISYAGNERMQVGETIAVYDLGGGTFDAAVLRKTADGFEVLGRPDGIERLGGIDFDEAVFSHVARTLASSFESLDPDDLSARSAVARLRDDCIDAKEALSSDTDVVIPVILPAVQTEVRLTRSEFEDLIRPALSPTADALSRALASAGVLMADLRAILLVGGSSQIPLVGQLLAERLGCPVAIDAHPKHTVAMGAARAGLSGAVAVPATPLLPPPPPPPPSGPPRAAPPVASPSASPPAEPPPPPPTAPQPPPPPPPGASAPPPAPTEPSDTPEPPPVGASTGDDDRRRKRRRVLRIVGVVVLVYLVLSVAARVVVSVTDGSGDGGAASSQASLGFAARESDAEVQQAIAAVLAAEQAYYEEHGEYTEDHAEEDPQSSDAPERLTGVSVPDVATDYGFYPRETGVVMFWIGYKNEGNQIDGALYLGVLAGSERCFYARANGGEVLTAVNLLCDDATELEYSKDAWELP